MRRKSHGISGRASLGLLRTSNLTQNVSVDVRCGLDRRRRLRMSVVGGDRRGIATVAATIRMVDHTRDNIGRTISMHLI